MPRREVFVEWKFIMHVLLRREVFVDHGGNELLHLLVLLRREVFVQWKFIMLVLLRREVFVV